MRPPTPPMTAEQLLAQCRENGRADICAGHVLAIQTLLEEWKWCQSRLAEASGVPRQMIGMILALKRFPTGDCLSKLAGAFGLDLFELDLIAKLEMRKRLQL